MFYSDILSGLELQVLKEEFTHHQDKINQYHSLLKDVENGDESESFLPEY